MKNLFAAYYDINDINSSKNLNCKSKIFINNQTFYM